MPNQKLIAKIHIALKDLDMDDPTYRDLLYRKFKVSTSTALTDSQANVLINHFKALGWAPKSKPKKYDDQKGDLYSASPEIKRKIEAMWHDIYRGNNETKHLRQWLFRKFKISDVRFLDKRSAYDAVEALKAMQKRRTRNTVTDGWDIKGAKKK
jgi:phage gp16-like protein